jgi:hypothetical protein
MLTAPRAESTAPRVLLVTDIVMRMDGIEPCHRMRRRATSPSLPYAKKVLTLASSRTRTRSRIELTRNAHLPY